MWKDLISTPKFRLVLNGAIFALIAGVCYLPEKFQLAAFVAIGSLLTLSNSFYLKKKTKDPEEVLAEIKK